MCFPTMTALGSILLLFAFILEVFIMIGNLANKTFLNIMYFLIAINSSTNQSIQWGLWNYCRGDASGTISSCGSHTPAFDWARTPILSQLAPSTANSSLVRGLFLGMFILFFIGCIFSFLFWLASLPICCLNRRGHGISMATLVGINFLVMLAALILALVIVITGVKEITGSNIGWEAHAGNLLWVTIGAVVSLFLSFLCYTCGSICGPSKRRNKAVVDPNYNDKYGANSNYMTSPMFVPANQQQNLNAPGQTTMLQQPYAVSPSTGNQHLSPSMAHNTGNTQTFGTTGDTQTFGPNQPNQINTAGIDNTLAGQQNNNYDPNSVSVPMHGYQTPTLQPANTPHQAI